MIKTREEFLKRFPQPERKMRGFRCQKDPELFNLALELLKMGYDAKLVSRELGMGYDSLLRATRKERTVKRR